MDNLNKPITIVRAEFISNLVKLINETALPAFVMESILKDICLEVKGIAQKQYELDVEKYEELKRKYLDKKEDMGDLIE